VEKLVNSLVRESEEFGCIPTRQADRAERVSRFTCRGVCLLFGIMGALSATHRGLCGAADVCRKLHVKNDGDFVTRDVRVLLARVETFDFEPQRNRILQIAPQTCERPRMRVNPAKRRNCAKPSTGVVAFDARHERPCAH